MVTNDQFVLMIKYDQFIIALMIKCDQLVQMIKYDKFTIVMVLVLLNNLKSPVEATFQPSTK